MTTFAAAKIGLFRISPPLSLPTLTGWWDATDLIGLPNGTASGLSDKSGNGYHFVQSGGANMPSKETRNSFPALYFDASNSEKLASSASLADLLTVSTAFIAVVVELNGLPSVTTFPASLVGNVIIGDNDGWQALTVSTAAGIPYYTAGAFLGGGTWSAWARAKTGARQLVIFKRDASRIRLSVDGGSEYVDQHSGTTGSSTMMLGHTSFGGAYLNGWIYEIVTAPSMTVAEEETLITYLLAKWDMKHEDRLSVGFTNLVFNETFANTSGIDMANAQTDGFNFYRKRPFGYPTLDYTADFTVGSGVLTLNISAPHLAGVVDMLSLANIGAGEYFYGGAYFEIIAAFDPTLTGRTGWPAIWMMAVEHLYGGENNLFFETDLLEFFGTEQHSFNTTMHLYDTVGGNQSTPTSTDFRVRPRGDQDFSVMHKYGLLFIPGQKISLFFDDKWQRDYLYADYPWLGTAGTWDDQGWPIMLGCGDWPTQFDSVKVWQAPA
jgi:hypothetical protein